MGARYNYILASINSNYHYIQMIRGDSKDYNLLDNWVRGLKIETSKVLTCEIGVREGLGSKIIMDGIRGQATGNYMHIGIDPYGNLKY